jgi:putative peptide zinc metalloprotease protein
MERHVKRRLFAVLTALATIGLGAVPVLADNSGVAINTNDTSDVFKLSFKIERINREVANPINVAFAYASCSACQTVAIAWDVVFITGSSSVITPVNAAFAINYQCDRCSTLADAYQFVLTTGGQVHLTPDGNRELAQIRQQLEMLRKQDLNILEVEQQLGLLREQLKAILTTEIVPAGSPPGSPPAESPGATSPAPASPGASESPSPAASSEPSATPTSSPTSSPSPSSSASP